jgi:hypothetical protein
MQAHEAKLAAMRQGLENNKEYYCPGDEGTMMELGAPVVQAKMELDAPAKTEGTKVEQEPPVQRTREMP